MIPTIASVTLGGSLSDRVAGGHLQPSVICGNISQSTSLMLARKRGP
jgi:hypothetical protein